MLWLKSNHVNKRGHWPQQSTTKHKPVHYSREVFHWVCHCSAGTKRSHPTWGVTCQCADYLEFLRVLIWARYWFRLHIYVVGVLLVLDTVSHTESGSLLGIDMFSLWFPVISGKHYRMQQCCSWKWYIHLFMNVVLCIVCYAPALRC